MIDSNNPGDPAAIHDLMKRMSEIGSLTWDDLLDQNTARAEKFERQVRDFLLEHRATGIDENSYELHCLVSDFEALLRGDDDSSEVLLDDNQLNAIRILLLRQKESVTMG